MANERHQQSRPVADEPLAGQRDVEAVNLGSGGVGPSGTDFNSTGHLGGVRGTADGYHARQDGDPSVRGDHSLDGASIIDTNLIAGGPAPDPRDFDDD